MSYERLTEKEEADFDQWLEGIGTFDLPLCRWGPNQTHIAVRYAQHCVHKALDAALNSGDGSYKP